MQQHELCQTCKEFFDDCTCDPGEDLRIDDLVDEIEYEIEYVKMVKENAKRK